MRFKTHFRTSPSEHPELTIAGKRNRLQSRPPSYYVSRYSRYHSHPYSIVHAFTSYPHDNLLICQPLPRNRHSYMKAL